MRKQIEILAPAGSYEGMKAAMNAGCDAVYIGGSSFGARAFANNLDSNMLLHAIDEAHIRDKKLYLTVNTLLKEKEHKGELYNFLEPFYLQGLDAVIVQDVGVLHFIHDYFPDLPIHASTQMTLTMAQGANQLKDYGVTRIVTSRELNLKEIKTIRENTELEIETFVHGALCYCYSGQCLMSSIIGGRSGNRGRCAQPCRMPYQFYDDNNQLLGNQEKYLLSPKDINTLTIIPELVEAGIDSFKIEGRMKRAEYAAAVASVYRKYVDYYLEQGKEKYQLIMKSSEFENDMISLQDVYNRGGFSEGYGKTYHGKSMMSLTRPNHSGVHIGKVIEKKGTQVGISLSQKVNAQDILEIRNSEEDSYEYTLKDSHDVGEIIWTNVGRRMDKDTSDRRVFIRIGAFVYRTKNNELLQKLSNDYLDKDKKLGVRGHLVAKVDEKLALTLTYKDCEVTAYQNEVQTALKQPMTRDKLAASIEKTGDTLYYFEELTIDADENVFVPVAWLNDIRRDAIKLLQEAVIGKYKRNLKETKITSDQEYRKAAAKSSENTKQNFGVCITVQNYEQFTAALSFEEVTAIYADYDYISLQQLKSMAKEAKEAIKDYYVSLPHICRHNIYDRLKKDLLEIIKKKEITGFIIKNFEEVELVQSLLIQEKQEKELILNYNMYVYNQEAMTFWSEKGIDRFTAPIELNYQELRALGIQACDMVVYGYLPLMVSAQCLYENTVGCAKSTPLGKNRDSFTGKLTDRLGKKFIVKTNCNSCFNVIYNGQPLALYKQTEEIRKLKPYQIRLDFTQENYDQTKDTIRIFINRLDYQNNKTEEIEDYTTGHFKRGVE